MKGVVRDVETWTGHWGIWTFSGRPREPLESDKQASDGSDVCFTKITLTVGSGADGRCLLLARAGGGGARGGMVADQVGDTEDPTKVRAVGLERIRRV